MKQNTPVSPVENPVENSSEDEQKIAELTSDLQRTRADFENYRKQMEQQREHAENVVKITTVLKFLPLLDDIDRAINSYPEQLLPLKKTLEKTLEGLKLKKIDSSEGMEFDHDLHEAVLMEDGEGERDVIVETLRPGYYYENEVVRTAMVKVGKA